MCNLRFRTLAPVFCFCYTISRKAGAYFIENSIEQFSYGNIDPQARSTRANKSMSTEMQTLGDTEEFLTEKLTDENKNKFLDYVNAWSVVNGESNLDSFIMGFHIEARFTVDTFISSEAPFKEYDSVK